MSWSGVDKEVMRHILIGTKKPPEPPPPPKEGPTIIVDVTRQVMMGDREVKYVMTVFKDGMRSLAEEIQVPIYANSIDLVCRIIDQRYQYGYGNGVIREYATVLKHAITTIYRHVQDETLSDNWHSVYVYVTPGGITRIERMG